MKGPAINRHVRTEPNAQIILGILVYYSGAGADSDSHSQDGNALTAMRTLESAIPISVAAIEI